MQFRGEFYFLSNMYPHEIEFSGMRFSCVESAFQALKCANLNDMFQFQDLNGFEAKRIGRRVQLCHDWDEVKVDFMYQLLQIKFSDENLKSRLISTYPLEIVEDNTWNDTFWGRCNGRGKNILGKLLMEIRAEAINSWPE